MTDDITRVRQFKYFSGVESSGTFKTFISSSKVQTGAGTHLASSSKEIELFPVVQWQRRDADLSFPPSADSKNWGIHASTPPVYLRGVNSENFALTYGISDKVMQECK